LTAQKPNLKCILPIAFLFASQASLKSFSLIQAQLLERISFLDAAHPFARRHATFVYLSALLANPSMLLIDDECIGSSGFKSTLNHGVDDEKE